MSSQENNKFEIVGGAKCPKGMIERVGYYYKRKTSKSKEPTCHWQRKGNFIWYNDSS